MAWVPRARFRLQSRTLRIPRPRSVYGFSRMHKRQGYFADSGPGSSAVEQIDTLTPARRRRCARRIHKAVLVS
eukprot:scaffold770_cov255-Pinguiococcus_pyrenoidosus.AAC.50